MMAFTFEEWEKDYNYKRPVEPCSESENAEQWACIVDYAEDKLKDAFEAGQRAEIENDMFDKITDKILTILFICILFVGCGIGMSYIIVLLAAVFR